jgi:exodeoxyribonuclease-5
MGILLNEKQNHAIKRAIKWYFDNRKDKKIFVISGYAGTGKTTMVRALVDILGLSSYQVLYTSFTGKAVEILRRKGCQANTIHRTFYSIYKSDGKIRFKRKNKLSTSVKLVVIDELSMVNDHMMKDIIAFNIPIIGIGDSAQLPPIYGSNNYMMNPDVMLTEIMRQKGDIGVLKLAEMSRKGEYIPFGQYIESKVIHVSEIENIEKYDVVLCWKNVTRKNINLLIRNILGFTSPYPMKGEKLFCLKNNYFYMLEYDTDIPIFLVNGMDLICIENEKDGKGQDYLNLTYRPSFVRDSLFKTRVHKGPFDSYKRGENYIIEEDDDDVVFLDYGYCSTGHRAQGTEHNNVLVIDEFRGDGDMYNKWLYTAITRARISVTVARYL